jgi:hypothetical protein
VGRLYVRRASVYGARPHCFVLYRSRLSDQRSVLRPDMRSPDMRSPDMLHVGALCSHVRSSNLLGPGAL